MLFIIFLIFINPTKQLKIHIILFNYRRLNFRIINFLEFFNRGRKKYHLQYQHLIHFQIFITNLEKP